MTSKKTTASKRAAFPRAADYAKSFYKDWQRLTQSGRYDMKRLKEAMLLLMANDAPWGQSGLIIRWAAIGRAIVNAISGGIFCCSIAWRTWVNTAW